MALQTHTTRGLESPSTETVPWQVDACPACGAALVDGQGVLACVDCEWSGTVA